MSMQVRVKITGVTEEIARLEKLGDKLTDFSDAMKEIGEKLKRYFGGSGNIPGQVFGSEGSIYGSKWASLSPVYRKWKGKHYPGKGVLVASGNLLKSFNATSDRNSVTIDNTATTKSGLNLLSILQNGTGGQGQSSPLRMGLARSMLGLGASGFIGRGNNLPARVVMQVNDDVEGIAQNIIDLDVQAKMKAVQ